MLWIWREKPETDHGCDRRKLGRIMASSRRHFGDFASGFGET